MTDPNDTRPTAETEALTALQEQLDQEKTRRKQERFIWLIVLIVVLDIAYLSEIKSPVVPALVGVLELVALFIVARSLGLRSAMTAITEATKAFGHRD